MVKKLEMVRSKSIIRLDIRVSRLRNSIERCHALSIKFNSSENLWISSNIYIIKVNSQVKFALFLSR